MLANQEHQRRYLKWYASRSNSSHRNILIGEDVDYLDDYNYIKRIYWDLAFPHMVVVGNSGSGKTTALLSILVQLSRTPELQAELYIIDYKGLDYAFLEDNGCERYYQFERCKEGLETIYERFMKRRKGEDKSTNLILVVLDEWSSFLNSVTDKKELESIKQKTSQILAMSRAFHMSCIFCVQRADAELFFKNRDNLSAALAMGNISKESQAMLFDDCKDKMNPIDEIGVGYFRQGSQLNKVYITKYPDEVVEESIMDMMI